MARITLFAQSGTEEPFKVVFTREDGKLTIKCSCQEGVQGSVCEHKIRFASNDHLLLTNPGQMRDLMEAHLWVIQSPVSDLILRLFDLQKEEDPDDAQVARTAHEIGTAMREGTLMDS